MPHQLFIDSPSDNASGWLAIVERLRSSSRVLALTGAGVSAESGLPTFRAGGLWESFRFEDVATPEAFARDPRLVWRFYNHRRQALRAAVPNAGHTAIAEMGERWGSRFMLVTQNVDGLHQLAGSKDVVELHGNLKRVRCIDCGSFIEGLDAFPELPRCSCGGMLRPDVVWFGESLPGEALLRARRAADRGGALLVIGTTAQVYPAAGLIDLARSAGAFVVEINPAETGASGSAHALLRGTSATMLPHLVRLWFQAS